MKIHEYQAKQILKRFAIEIPKGDVAFSPKEAFAIASRLGGRCVLKAQIHAGGRGKGGVSRSPTMPTRRRAWRGRSSA